MQLSQLMIYFVFRTKNTKKNWTNSKNRNLRILALFVLLQKQNPPDFPAKKLSNRVHQIHTQKSEEKLKS